MPAAPNFAMQTGMNKQFGLALLLAAHGCTADIATPVADMAPTELAALKLSAATLEPARYEQVVIDKLTFDVRTAGPKDGDVVILLHGFPESSYEWRATMPLLAAAGYRVIAPDMRGTSPGARPTTVASYGLLNYVGDVLALADAYGASRFHLVGHDVGGLVAWGTGQFFGGRLRSLTAISVPHPGAYAAELADPSSCQSKASAWYEDLLADGAAQRLLAGQPPILLEAWASVGPDAEAEYRRLLGTPEALDATINTWRANYVDGQPQGALPLPVLLPTQFIYGDEDAYNCGDYAEPMTRSLVWAPYRAARLQGVGHFLPEQAADQFNTLLLTHLRQHP